MVDVTLCPLGVPTPKCLDPCCCGPRSRRQKHQAVTWSDRWVLVSMVMSVSSPANEHWSWQSKANVSSRQPVACSKRCKVGAWEFEGSWEGTCGPRPANWKCYIDPLNAWLSLNSDEHCETLPQPLSSLSSATVPGPLRFNTRGCKRSPFIIFMIRWHTVWSECTCFIEVLGHVKNQTSLTVEVHWQARFEDLRNDCDCRCDISD